MEELIVTLSKIIGRLHVQDTRTLELLTQLIQSVSRIEDRVTVLETGRVILQQQIQSLREDDESDRIQ